MLLRTISGDSNRDSSIGRRLARDTCRPSSGAAVHKNIDPLAPEQRKTHAAPTHYAQAPCVVVKEALRATGVPRSGNRESELVSSPLIKRYFARCKR